MKIYFRMHISWKHLDVCISKTWEMVLSKGVLTQLPPQIDGIKRKEYMAQTFWSKLSRRSLLLGFTH